MKVTKWIEFSQEVDIDISATDVEWALSEVFSESRDDKKEPNVRIILRSINACAVFLKAIPESKITEMNEAQRRTIAKFFADQAERFAVEVPAEARG